MPMQKGQELNRNIYAAYKGDEYIMEGTIKELCAALGKERKNLLRYTFPSHQARMKMLDLIGERKSKGRFSLVLVESRGKTETQEKTSANFGKLQGKYVRAYMTEKMYGALKACAESKNVPVSEIVRECCQYALERGFLP